MFPWMDSAQEDEEDATTLEAVWGAHRRTLGGPAAVVPRTFSKDAVVVYVGTGVVYRGHGDIERLYAQWRESWPYIQSSRLVWKTVDERRRTVVAESVLTIQHNRPVAWLLPSVPDTGELLHVPMVRAPSIFCGRLCVIDFCASSEVTVAAFDGDGMCTAERVWWDHAALLNQCRFLGRNVRLRTLEGNTVEVSIPQAKITDTVKALWDAAEVAHKHITTATVSSSGSEEDKVEEVAASLEVIQVEGDEAKDDEQQLPSDKETATVAPAAVAAEAEAEASGGRRGRSFAGGASRVVFG
ncbi:hypothetical protein RI367_007171 [Sorochytrium milnesiophthora]